MSSLPLLKRVWRNKAFAVGGGLLLLIVLFALFAPWLSPHDPYVQDLANRTVPPVWKVCASLSRSSGRGLSK